MRKKKVLSKNTAYLILYWCMSTYGRSKLNGAYPDIEYKKADYLTGDVIGHYDDIEGTIFVNKILNDSLEELVNTIIHEYTHYVKHSMHEYFILAKYLSDERNPLEIDARRIARKDSKKCLKFLKEEYSIYEY